MITFLYPPAIPLLIPSRTIDPFRQKSTYPDERSRSKRGIEKKGTACLPFGAGRELGRGKKVPHYYLDRLRSKPRRNHLFFLYYRLKSNVYLKNPLPLRRIGGEGEAGARALLVPADRIIRSERGNDFSTSRYVRLERAWTIRQLEWHEAKSRPRNGHTFCLLNYDAALCPIRTSPRGAYLT